MIDYNKKKENVEQLLNLYEQRKICLDAIENGNFGDIFFRSKDLDLDSSIVSNIEKLYVDTFKRYISQILEKTETQIKEYDRTNL